MTRSLPKTLILVVFVCLLFPERPAATQDEEKSPIRGTVPLAEHTWDPATAYRVLLRQSVLGAENSRETAAAYRALFSREGFAGYTDDDNTGIALQANWEINKVFVARSPEIRHRSDWVLDQDRVNSFLEILRARIGTDPPTWWKNTLLNGSGVPGQRLGFFNSPWPENRKTGNGWWVTGDVELDNDRQQIRVSIGAESVLVPRRLMSATAHLGPRCTVVLHGDACYVAHYGDFSYPFKLIRVNLATERIDWATEVWASRTGFSSGPSGSHSVELRAEDDELMVFGAEVSGVYLEVFDADTGECAYRFCTCYWFNSPETWGIEAFPSTDARHSSISDQ